MFDAVTLAAVADELNEKVLHGRVQEIVQLDALTFGFEIYAQHARHYLLATLHPEDARVHRVSTILRGSGETPSSLLLLLRKHTEGACIDAVEQLPHERVLNLRFDHSTEGISTLVVETIGRYSNLILVDAGGTVLDALKRVTQGMNRTRVTLPRQPYAPPPPQNKLDPTQLTVPLLTRALEQALDRPVPFWQALVQSVSGVSPLLAREIVFRVSGDRSAPIKPARATEIILVLNELTRPPWHPTVAFQEEEPLEYAPYPLNQFPDTRPSDSISAAIETFYGAPEAYAAAKEPLRVQIAAVRDRLARKRDALAMSLPAPEATERLRVSGELVLAYAAQIQPGQTTLAAETEDGITHISLDPKLTAVENAQRYFKEYHRAKDAAARVPALLEAASAEVEYAEQMLNDLTLAENRGELDAVVQAAREAGLLSTAQARRKAVPSEPRVVTSQDGFTILVGKNARQNEEITFHRARPDDVWLHARDVAGAHVIVVKAGREVPETTIREAAELAARYSQARGQGRVDVIVTIRRNVQRMRGKKTGMVRVSESRTVGVAG